MAMFPKVQSPCPYKGPLSDIMDGEKCRLCKREVFDLTHMSDGERVAFMKGCSGEVCVTYRFPVRPAIAAAAIAVASFALPAAAAACEDATDASDVVVVGGIKDPANVQYVRDTSGSTLTELPVVYERSPGGAAMPSDHTGDGNTAPSPVSSPAAP